MSNKLLSGKLIAERLLNEVNYEIKSIISSNKRVPTLAVVLVGNNPASEVYVRNKKMTCVKVGINSQEFKLPDNVGQDELLKLIDTLNNNREVDGILVQLPLPSHLSSKLVIDSISPNKDVDGFHRYNMGSLTLKDPTICPCTPHGIMYMLDTLNIEFKGLHAIVIGSSNIVGRPMALELLNRGATITVCNSKTRNVVELASSADILIAAVGVPKLLKANWVKDGAIVIDVGINRLDDGSLCGDVDFSSVIDKVRYITPVPGGVGLMTIAMLMKNTLFCYNLNNKN